MTEKGVQDLVSTAALLRDQATALVKKSGLYRALEHRFGRAAIVGSVDLDLMTWRDVDIYVPVEVREKPSFLQLLTDLEAGLEEGGCRLIRATFNDEWIVPRGDYGHGYYWGLRVRTCDAQTWKLDVWGWSPATFQSKLEEHRTLKEQLQASDRALILKLKSEVMDLPEFRRSITSRDVYDFVLHGKGTSVEQLLAYVALR